MEPGDIVIAQQVPNEIWESEKNVFCYVYEVRQKYLYLVPIAPSKGIDIHKVLPSMFRKATSLEVKMMLDNLVGKAIRTVNGVQLNSMVGRWIPRQYFKNGYPALKPKLIKNKNKSRKIVHK